MIKNLTSKKKKSGGRRSQRKEESPFVDRKTDRHHIHAFFNIDDVQERALSMNDLLTVELINDNVKKFHQS